MTMTDEAFDGLCRRHAHLDSRVEMLVRTVKAQDEQLVALSEALLAVTEALRKTRVRIDQVNTQNWKDCKHG
jgi:hypothetical protein